MELYLSRFYSLDTSFFLEFVVLAEEFNRATQEAVTENEKLKILWCRVMILYNFDFSSTFTPLSVLDIHVNHPWFLIWKRDSNMLTPILVCTVKPMKGDALLFFSLHPDATTDNTSLHGSCPVIEGEKWSATKWIHVRSFDSLPSRRAASECVDEDPNCPAWALKGECEKNPLYMVGSEEAAGYCRKSCKVCSS